MSKTLTKEEQQEIIESLNEIERIIKGTTEEFSQPTLISEATEK